jgi:hypothetical protein
MPRTANDLVVAVLQELTVTNAVQNPSAEDAALIWDPSTSPPSGHWPTINAELGSLHVSTWTDNSIPDKVFEPLHRYVAACIARKFGAVGADDEAAIERKLNFVRRAIAMPYSGGEAEGTYF